MTDDDKLVAFETAINLMLEAQERLSNVAEISISAGLNSAIPLAGAMQRKNGTVSLMPKFTMALKILRNFPELPDILSMIALQAKKTKADAMQNTTI